MIPTSLSPAGLICLARRLRCIAACVGRRPYWRRGIFGRRAELAATRPVCRRISDRISTFRNMSTNIGRARGREVASSKNRRRCWVENSLGTTMRNSRVLSGSTTLDYGENGSASASVKLQELFGLAEMPMAGPRQVPILFHLLAPSGRTAVQTTRDLRSFWETTYLDVRKSCGPLSQAPLAGRPVHGAGDPSDNEETLKRRSAPQRKRDGLGASVQLRIRALAHLRPLVGYLRIWVLLRSGISPGRVRTAT